MREVGTIYELSLMEQDRLVAQAYSAAWHTMAGALAQTIVSRPELRDELLPIFKIGVEAGRQELSRRGVEPLDMGLPSLMGRIGGS